MKNYIFSYARYSIVFGELIIFANNADEKSKQKQWISYFNDLFKSPKIHWIMFSSTKYGISSFFALNFYKVAMENRYVTLPNSCYF